jgi:maltose O-acetyltransferase
MCARRHRHVPTERERMLAGETYDSRDPELLALAQRARQLLLDYRDSASTDADGRRGILEALFASIGDGSWIEPPFFCEYGAHIHLGPRTFVHVNGVMLDSAEIRIGADTLIGPGVQIITATHPLRADERIDPSWEPGSGRAPYRTSAQGIRVGSRVWIGAGSIITPGVSIGDDVTIGAGSVVTRDIPSGTVAFGQPCRVHRTL